MKRILTVALYTYRELLRSKMLFVWLLCAATLCGLAFLLSLLSYGNILNIFMDLGLVGMEFSGLLVLLLGLAVTYTTEMDQKSIFLQMAKPVTRGEYLMGRVLGFFFVNALVVLGMGALVVFLVVVVGGGQVPGLVWASIAAMLLEMFVLTVLGLTYQMIATSMVGVVLYTFFTVLLGHCVGQIQWLLGRQMAPAAKYLLEAVRYILPNLEIFNLKDRIYDPTLVLTWAQWQDMLLYAFAYSFMAFLVGWIAFEKREFR